MSHLVICDEEKQQFRIHLEQNEFAVVKYTFIAPNCYVIESTKVPERLQGKGYGSVMMESVLPVIESRQGKIDSRCSYVSYYLARHSQWQHLLVDEL